MYFSPGLIKWDGQTWTNLGTPKGYRDVMPYALLVNGADVYCEVFPEPSDAGLSANKAVAKWNGTSWSVVAVTSTIGEGGLKKMAFAHAELYGSGSLYEAADPVHQLNFGRLNPPNWVRVGGGMGYGLSVYGLASDGNNLFVQGTFVSAGDQPADGFAIWDGSHWTAPSAASRSNLRVDALTSNAGEVLASELITRGLEVVDQYLVRYVGTNRTVLARGESAQMTLMRRARDGIYCTGEFRGVAGVATGNLARWNGTNWSRVGEGVFHGLSGNAKCLSVAGTNVYAGGTFEYAGNVAAKHVARWNGQQWHPLGRGIDGTVTQLAARATDLFVIGRFALENDSSVTNIARWDGSNWRRMGDGLAGNLSAIAANECEVFVARILNSTNLLISRWDGTNWSDIAGGNFGYGRIFALLPTTDSLFLGGTFERIDDVVMNNVARWDGSHWRSLGQGLFGEKPWVPNDNPFTSVNALLSDGTNIYAGGSFTNASGVPAQNVACWDGVQWSALGAGLPGFGSCLFGSCFYPVTSLATVKGKLFAGGGFQTGSAGSKGRLAMWTGSTWSNVFEEWGGGRVWALASSGAELFIAGDFASIGTAPSYGFAVWHESPSPLLESGLTNGRVVLSWPRGFQRAVLESAASLTQPAWLPANDTPWETSETLTNDVRVELPPGPQSQGFFRLRWQ
jgi:hypothetical protein